MKTVAIEFVRQVLEQTLYEEHLKDNSYCGGINQVGLFSFYEQLLEGKEVDRFIENYSDLISQQNRSSLILNGVITAPENPQIINIHTHDIRPLDFRVGFRLNVLNRDMAIDTIENMFSVLKGRKRDVALFDSGKLLMVNTIANNVLGKPEITDDCFIGELADMEDINSEVVNRLNEIFNVFGTGNYTFTATQLYFEFGGYMYKTKYDSESDEWGIDETFEYHAQRFTKYKVSISFDTTRVDEPRTLNGEEPVTISFGGSATIVSGEVELGNDLTKVSFKKSLIKAQTNITLTDSVHWLEPLEMPNNLGIANEINQLASSNFLQGKQNTGINPTLSYSFVLDKSEPLIYQWWKYARYGIQGKETDTPTYSTGVTPNTIYEIVEYWSSWGTIEKITYNAKATENVEVENTESDAISIKLNFEVQP